MIGDLKITAVRFGVHCVELNPTIIVELRTTSEVGSVSKGNRRTE